jgi:hypothetical protein
MRRGRLAGRGPAISGLVVVVALLAVGCGGQSAEERYAEEVCSTILPLAQDVSQAYDEVKAVHPAAGRDAWAEIYGHVLGSQEIAAQYAAKVRALPTLDGAAGQSAKDFLDHSAVDSVEILADEEQSLRQLPWTITRRQSTVRLQQLELALVRVLSAMTAAPVNIASVVPELSEAFQKAHSCIELGKVGAG